MPLPFCRLPLVAIREVMKSMDFREIFLLPLISKRSRDFVSGSISRNFCFSTSFTVSANRMCVKLMKSKHYDERIYGGTYRLKNELLTMRYSDDCLLYEWTGKDSCAQNETSIRMILCHLVIAFKDTKMSIDFEGLRDKFAMELIRFCRHTASPRRVTYRLFYTSSEAIQDLLNGAEENSDLILKSIVPENFNYTPPSGGYKFNTLHVDNAHWMKIEDFVQCRKVKCYYNAPFLSSQELKNLFKKVANMEYRIERLYLCSKFYKDSDLSEITEGLNGSQIKQCSDKQEVKFCRIDGAKMIITLTSWCLHMKKMRKKQ
ncbi:unnamed protein product [Caenorhabditis brenneri]